METDNRIPDFEGLAMKIISEAPRMAGVEAAKFFRQGFVKGGFTDRAFSPWPRRKSPLSGKRLLFGTGNLMRSIRPRQAGANMAVVVSDTPYSAIQNDGGASSESIFQ